MASDSESEVMEESEIDQLRGQLKMYQKLNIDLSKKVQELKVMVNFLNKELVHARNQLMEEQLKTSDMRRSLSIMNGHCTNFFNTYILNLEKCIQRTNLDITLPGQPSTSAAAAAQLLKGPGAIAFKPPSKIQGPIEYDPNQQNLLLTIREESQLNITSFPATSTPLNAPPNVLRERQNIPNPPEIVIETSELNFKTPARPIAQRLSARFCVQNEETTMLDEESGHEDLSNVAPSNDIRYEAQLKDIKLRQRTVVELTNSVEITKEMLDEYEKMFGTQAGGDSTSNLDISTEASDGGELDGPSTSTKSGVTTRRRKTATNATLETSAEANGDESDASSTSSTKSKPTRRRKIALDIPRRSIGRPKRKARPGSLTELRLNRKMRRS